MITKFHPHVRISGLGGNGIISAAKYMIRNINFSGTIYDTSLIFLVEDSSDQWASIP